MIIVIKIETLKPCKRLRTRIVPAHSHPSRRNKYRILLQQCGPRLSARYPVPSAQSCSWLLLPAGFFFAGKRCREVVEISLVLDDAPILVDLPVPRLCHEIVPLSLSSVAYHPVSSIFHLLNLFKTYLQVSRCNRFPFLWLRRFGGPVEASIGNQHEQSLSTIRVRILAPWLKPIRNL